MPVVLVLTKRGALKRDLDAIRYYVWLPIGFFAIMLDILGVDFIAIIAAVAWVILGSLAGKRPALVEAEECTTVDGSVNDMS